MMDSDQRQRVRVVITATAANGDKIDLLAYPTGQCGLARNGTPLPKTLSTPCDPNQCAAELLRLCGLN